MSWEQIVPVVGLALIWLSILFIFVIMVGWLIRFSRMVAKSQRAWRAHTGGYSEQDTAYALRQQFTKHILCLLFICTIVIFIPIMGVHNGNILLSYDPSREVELIGECNVSSQSWLGDRYRGGDYFSWLEHSQWQPFAILSFSVFELIVLQMVTVQFTNTNRLFTWQVKVTFCFAILEFIAVFLLNCFLPSILFGHSLYVLLLVIHLFIVDLCIMRIYCLMRRQIADLAHLKSRDYYQSLKHRTHIQAFFIPVIFLVHIMVVIEVLFAVAIVLETILVNQCWVTATYGVEYQSWDWDEFEKKGHTQWILILEVCRQFIGMASLWYLVVAQLVYSLKEWKKEKEAKENSWSSVMQESDDIVVPLMKNEQAVN